MTSSDSINPNLQRRTALAGIGFMLAGVLFYSLNDVMGKWLVATYTVGQVLLIRSGAALIVLAPIVWREGLTPYTTMPRPGLQLVRVALGAAEVAFFYWSVTYLPLADVVAYYMAGPIYVTAISALFLGERVDPARWLAVIVGFIGVVIALDPTGAAFSGPALIALAGSVVYALLLVTTRTLRGASDVVLTSTQIAASFVIGLFAAPFAWVAPSLRDFVLLGLLGVVAMAALTFVNRSLRLAPASVVVPYQYTMILWAVVFGWTVFGDVPPARVIVGSAIIVAAGLFIFLREQRARRA